MMAGQKLRNPAMGLGKREGRGEGREADYMSDGERVEG